MELYILDNLLRRVEVVDRFESLIWTDRFAEVGDFELVIQSTPYYRELLKEDTWVAVTESDRVMIIDSVEDNDDSEGRSKLTVTGRSLEYILTDRIARITTDSLTLSPRWALAETPGNLVRHIFDRICRYGDLDKRDIIPFLDVGSFYPADTIPEPSDVIRVELEPDTLLKTMQDLCNPYGLGFCLVRNPVTAKLHFIVYSGSDRTSAQRVLPATIFSPELDNLANVKELVSTKDYKNVAHVVAPEGSTIVYAEESDPAEKGFKRKVLLVKVDNVRDNPDENRLTVEEILQRRGKEALANHRRVYAFDGEIPKNGHKYNVDYRLGDIVEMRKANGLANYMRVTEQIFVSDAEGDRSYPTLIVDTFINPGSWFSWDEETVWDDFIDETWDKV